MTRMVMQESSTGPAAADLTAGTTMDAKQGTKPAQIIAAAKDLFTSQGFGATSMDAIARTANVSKATLYAHFSGKEELFAAMVSGECRAQSRMLTSPDVADRDVAEALAEIGRN